MSSQIQITGETKVKSLTGVLVGTSGVVSSLNIDGSLGIPQLDVNGKILVSQLPNSVMEYKGTWNISTNTPTLVNGTGNQGDVYLVEGAAVGGTAFNFGAGPITFFNGDQAIYSGSIWQRASGATGTVTSVAVTETGDSLNITGSPITTSGTINIGFNGTNLQYVNGAGNLTTFPILTGYVTAVSGTAPVVSSGGTTPAISMAAATASVDGYLSATDFAIFSAKQSALTFSSPLVNTSGTISIPAATTSVNGYLPSADFTTFNNKQNAITLTTTGTSGASTLVGATLNIPNYSSALTGYVPYTGATQDVDLGAFKLNAQSLHIKGTGGLGHLGLKHQSASATASANEVSLFADSLGDFSWLNGNLYLSKFITSGNTAARSYTFPNANGTVALTSDLANYVDLTTAQTIGGTKTFSDATKNNGGIFLQNASSNSLAGYMNIGGLTNGVKFTSGGGVSNTFTLPSATGYTFTFPNTTGTIALTSDIPTNPVGGTGTTNTLPKFTGASTIGNSNVTDTGSLITLGSNTNISSGGLGIGTTSLTGYTLRLAKSLTGSTSSFAARNEGVVLSDVTADAIGFRNDSNTQAAAFTLINYWHFWARQGTIGAGSAITNQYGYIVDSNMVGATNNYAFQGNIPSGTNRWNLYMNGTANNYMAGSLGIGSTSLTNANLVYNKTITGAVTSYGIFGTSIVGADVTNSARYYGTSVSTAASAFTLADLVHFYCGQGSFGAGSSVTNQYGFFVQSSLQSATNNYGFFGNIPSGTNRWNLYMAGAAANYMAGQTGIGTTTLGSYIFNVGGSVATLVNFNSTNASGFYTTYSTSGTERAYIGLGANTISGLGIADFGIVGSSNVVIASGSGGTETMRIDSSKRIGIGTGASINASAKVQIDSTTQGVLLPRMTAAQRAAIATPAEGLIVVQTDGTQGLYLYIGAAWHAITML